MFEIVTDSGSNLTPEAAKSRRIHVLPMHLEADGTAQVNPEICKNTLQSLSDRTDVLYICLSGKIGENYRAAQTAAEMVKTKNRIFVVDSKSASCGEGMLVRFAAELRDRNTDIESVCGKIRKASVQICHLFLAGETEEVTESVILTVDESGKILPCRKAADRKTALRHIAEMVQRTVLPSVRKICIAHAENPEEAAMLAGLLGMAVEMEELDPLFIHYTGPRTVAVFYPGTMRSNPLI